jgi:hypothetical protein
MMEADPVVETHSLNTPKKMDNNIIAKNLMELCVPRKKNRIKLIVISALPYVREVRMFHMITAL